MTGAWFSPLAAKAPGFSSLLTQSLLCWIVLCMWLGDTCSRSCQQSFLLGRGSLFWGPGVGWPQALREESEATVWGRKGNLWTAEKLWREDRKWPWDRGMLYSTWWDTLSAQWHYLPHASSCKDRFLCVNQKRGLVSELMWSDTETVCSTLKAELEETSWKQTLRNFWNPWEGLNCHRLWNWLLQCT